MAFAFILPKEKRRDFKYPRAVIFKKFPSKLLEGSKGIVCVGDVVSKNCLKVRNVHNLFLIYDGSTKRFEKVDDLEFFIKKEKFKTFTLKNPPGIISFHAFLFLCRILKEKGMFALRVVGEEDMLALPSIQCAPRGYWVLYGVPDVGVATIKVNELSKLDSSLRTLELRPLLKKI